MAFQLLQAQKRPIQRLAQPQFVHTASEATPSPFWVPGCGDYSKSLGLNCRTAAESSIPLILSRLDSIPVPSKSGVFTIGDYGTFNGFSSMNVIRKIIEHLRVTHGEGLSVQVLHEDQEQNDYNGLFRTLHDESSYLRDFTNVYPLVTNTNFYKQVVPNNFCDVIFSCMAAHWLPDSVPPAEETLFACLSSGEELRAFQEVSARHWSQWLSLRARELKTGGLLIVLSPSVSDSFLHGYARPKTRSELKADCPPASALSTYLDVEDSWRELRDKSIITEDEFRNAFFKAWHRSAREITQPFDDVTSRVRVAGLEKLHHDQLFEKFVPKEMWRQKLETEGVDDRCLFADSLTEVTRAWSYSSLRAALSDSRSEDEKDAILDQLYDVIRSRTAESDPETYRCEIYVSRLIAQKKK